MSAKNSENKMTEMDSKQDGAVSNSTKSSNGNSGEACYTNGSDQRSKNKTTNSSKNESTGKATGKAGSSSENCD